MESAHQQRTVAQPFSSTRLPRLFPNSASTQRPPRPFTLLAPSLEGSVILCPKSTKTAMLTTFRINTCKSVSKQRTLTGSVDILERNGAMPQAIEVKSQAQQQCLPHLQGQAATGGFRRELAFDHRDDRFYLRARAIPLAGDSTAHPPAPGSLREPSPRLDRATPPPS